MFEAGLLKGKTVIVTGGGTGLGKSMAIQAHCSEQGAPVPRVVRPPREV